MLRHLRLYGYFLRFSFSRALEFRLDFFFRVGMDALFYLTNLAFFSIVHRHTRLLGGWSEDQVLVFAAGVFFVDAMQMTVFSNNMWWLPILVNRGDLDYYLVRPVSPLYFLSLRDFAANSFLNLVLAGAILAWALGRYPEPLGPAAIALYLLLLLLGCLLHYALQMIFLLPVFWLHSAGGLREIFWSLDRYAGRPHGIFTGWTGRVLTSILPFALIVSFPSSALFDGFTLRLLGHMLAVIALALGFMGWLWRRALRAYASASS